MAERTKPGILSKEDIDKYGNYSPEKIAKLFFRTLWAFARHG